MIMTESPSPFPFNINRSVNGNIRSKFIHDQCMNINDYVIAWQLTALPYDAYMQLQSKRFYEITTPQYDQEDMSIRFFFTKHYQRNDHPLIPNYNGTTFYDSELINNLTVPNFLPDYSYAFSKLSADELMEVLDLYKVKYINPINRILNFIQLISLNVHLYI